MTDLLDRSALLDAMNAFWDADTTGNDKGIEAAIVAYLTCMRLARHHETVLAENERIRSRAPRSFPPSLQSLRSEQI